MGLFNATNEAEVFKVPINIIMLPSINLPHYPDSLSDNRQEPGKIADSVG